MKECWRWFGPDDPVTLSDLPQVGATGIVTALHQIPAGQPWPDTEIAQRKAMIEAAGLRWDVVESVPVSEAIKTQGADLRAHLDAYCDTLRALAAQGINVICYNFMPILDWTRTQTQAPQPHGGTAMLFDLTDFAAFDLFLLQRPGAAEDYDAAVREAAHRRIRDLDDAGRTRLIRTIVAGLPGANDGWTLADVRDRLATYDGIGPDRLRAHLIDFLSEVAPVAQDLGLRLCCHPDDPPFPLLGLPRVMSSTDDYARTLKAVDLPANGATLCTGSLGVAENFDVTDFIQRLGPRIHFAHLRNTTRLPGPDRTRPNFFEAPHLEGDTDMVTAIRLLCEEEAQRRHQGRDDCDIPMRPDHGQELLHDRDTHSLPGYPLIGRMRGLAELRGVMAAVRHAP
ncbi:mannonate dehydratase [Thalassococcus sp. S3]|uniref:mannonate dehydratase n=1 Tax=Thalassococcus sp. S3 TaxID=2017482 RepID=UPI0010240F2D|nr:mannonate dehydratase [Thalassococcus sp. S3]QBF34323.1 mannonate dehydratase [Thalassococcus sp. S3]